MDVAGLGQEVPARILAVDAELNGVADRCRVVVAERFAFGEAELLADEVDARDLLRDGVLDLQTRVDLQERDRAVSSDEELAGAGAEVTHLAQDRLRRLDEDAVLLIGEERCGCFLHELLMTSLQRAVAGRDHDDSALGIREALGLNVSGPVEVLLDEALAAPKCCDRLPRRGFEQLGNLVARAGDLQAAPATAIRGLDRDRQPMGVNERENLVGAGDGAWRARGEGRSDLFGDVACGDLVAQSLDGFR